jgi:hypothetical protein
VNGRRGGELDGLLGRATVADDLPLSVVELVEHRARSGADENQAVSSVHTVAYEIVDLMWVRQRRA